MEAHIIFDVTRNAYDLYLFEQLGDPHAGIMFSRRAVIEQAAGTSGDLTYTKVRDMTRPASPLIRDVQMDVVKAIVDAAAKVGIVAAEVASSKTAVQAAEAAHGLTKAHLLDASETRDRLLRLVEGAWAATHKRGK